MKKSLIFIAVLLVCMMILPAFAVSAAEIDRGVVVFIYQPVDGVIGEGDVAVIDFLTKLGFTVKTIDHLECTSADAEGVALLYIAESVASINVREGKYTKTSAPMFNCEMAAWEDTGFGLQLASFAEDTYPVTLSGNHEIIAATAQKSFDLMTEPGQSVVGLDISSMSADGIVLLAKDADNALFAAYEKGAKLIDGSSCTSRRIAGFIFGQTAYYFTDGMWAFMESMINWLSPPPVIEEVIVEEVAEEPAVIDGGNITAPVVTPTVPQTFDTTIIYIMVLILGLGTIKLIKLKR